MTVQEATRARFKEVLDEVFNHPYELRTDINNQGVLIEANILTDQNLNQYQTGKLGYVTHSWAMDMQMSVYGGEFLIHYTVNEEALKKLQVAQEAAV